jgi:hypothetical protein
MKKILIVLFVVFHLFSQAQTNTTGKLYIDDINRIYFQDIDLTYGACIAPKSSNIYGSVTNLSGSYFINRTIGFRSGVSLIMDMNNDTYLKMPALFAVRWKSVTSTSDSRMVEYHNFQDFFLNLFLNLFPHHYEVNIGNSLGYVFNSKYHFASSLDANFRMTYMIWRIGLNGNLGVNYLWTRNFVDKDNLVRKQFRPGWFVNLSAGLSFRF